MNPYASYHAINAKLSGRNKFFLTKEERKKITNFDTVEDMITFLKTKEGYKDIFLGSNNLHRAELEILLDRYVLGEIKGLRYYFSAQYKKFFDIFLMEYDIKDIEFILRSILRGERVDKERLLLRNGETKISNICNSLMSCNTIEECYKVLKDTVYGRILVSIDKEDFLRREFHIEMKLYILFFKELMEEAKKLSKRDYQITKQIIGIKIDYMNALWIYRTKKYYKLPPEEVLIYSLPYGYKLNYDNLKELVYISSIPLLKDKIEKRIKARIFSGNEEDSILGAKADYYLLSNLNKIDMGQNDIGEVLIYIYKLKIEINQLIILTEAIRYNLPKIELNKYLPYKLEIEEGLSIGD